MTNGSTSEQLLDRLRSDLGTDRVITDEHQRRLFSTDFYSEGEVCAAVIRPANTAALANAVRTISGAGFALIPRGGGMSYTGGYTPDSKLAVVVDLSDMNAIIAIKPDDMTITVGAGATWESIYEALKPLGLRLPFFGTFSGRLATVGGGLSNGAVFFGTARYGSAADQVLGLEVVCADGRVMRTGQAAFRNGKPFYRAYGPDLTGLFLHDCGAFGIKTEATFKLIETPPFADYLSFALPDAYAAAAALSAISRAGVAEEAYVFDPETTRKNLSGGDMSGNLRRLWDIVRSQGGVLRGLKAGVRVAVTGTGIVPTGMYSLHMTCAGRSVAATRADVQHARGLVYKLGGQEIPNSIPMAARATPFDNLNGVLGSAGERWAAVNAKLPHSETGLIIDAFDALVARNQKDLDELGISISRLIVAMDTHAFSFEAVFHWADQWLPPHRAVPDPLFLSKLTEPAANPAAAEFVGDIREQTMQLFAELGAASSQIGRAYPYRENLEAPAGDLLDALKADLDPDGTMNPGVLGLRR